MRCMSLAVLACAWSMPAGAGTVTLQFEAVVESLLPAEEAEETQVFTIDPGNGDLVFIDLGIRVPGPFLGDVVSGTLAFEIDAEGGTGAPSGSLQVAEADPGLETVFLSPVEVDDGVSRGTIKVAYEPNITPTDPTYDSSIEWLDAAIHVAAPAGDSAPPSSFLDLLAAPGAAPVEVDYTRISRGMVFFPGVDPDDCEFFYCRTARATVTSGTITLADMPAPVPLPASMTVLLAGLGGLAGFSSRPRRR